VAKPQPGRAIGSAPPVNRHEYVTIGGDAHLMQNETASEMVTIMGNAVVDGHVRNECVTIMGNVTINGSVGREVVCILGNVTVGPNAVVDGEIVSVGGQIEVHPTAIVGGEKVQVPAFGGVKLPSFAWLGQLVKEGFALGALFPFLRAWPWMVAGVLLLINLAFYLVFRRPIDACVRVLEHKPAIAFVSGILVFVLFGPLLFLLLVSVVGILIVPFLMAGTLVATICGFIAVFRYTGGQIGLQRSPLLAMIVGNVLLTALFGAPVVGIAIWMVTCLMGIGAAAAALIDSMRTESGGAVPPPPRPGPAGVPVAGGSAAAPPASGASLRAVAGDGAAALRGGGESQPAAEANAATPASAAGEKVSEGERDAASVAAGTGEALAVPVRVGFWPRLGATALDFLLIMGLLAFLNVQFLFPYVWLAYFIAFWSWRATTIGGVVLNLRIERLDGRRVDFGVAAVRALASIFSLLPAGLGFMWASWDGERQSWHDKIAGTTVVRLPRGQPLI